MALLLVFLVFLQPFGKVMVFVSFKMNQASIAKTLCVKKEIKNNSCQGKCQLKKKLAETSKEESRNLPQKLKEGAEVSYYFQVNRLPFLGGIQDLGLKRMFGTYTFLYDYSFSSDQFQPPQFA